METVSLKDTDIFQSIFYLTAEKPTMEKSNGAEISAISRLCPFSGRAIASSVPEFLRNAISISVAEDNDRGELREREKITVHVWCPSFAMGFEKELIRPGNGVKPAVGKTVTVHCTGFGESLWQLSFHYDYFFSLQLLSHYVKVLYHFVNLYSNRSG